MVDSDVVAMWSAHDHVVKKDDMKTGAKLDKGTHETEVGVNRASSPSEATSPESRTSSGRM